VVVVFLKTANF